MIPIGAWVLEEACRQMVTWQQKHESMKGLSMSVNLSGVQFQDPKLIEHINSILKATKLHPKLLKMEVTESMIMENEKSVHAMLYQLRENKIKLSIDDFGTGYSSLSFLHNFPFNTLKIDRSFVNDMGQDTQNLEMVRTIVMLAHNLEMDVCAEGVETREQYIQLKALRCELAQGYFFSKPMNAQATEKLIVEDPHW